jgi:hypothetical protein
MLERDVPLIDGIAARHRGRARPSPPPAVEGSSRVIAAVFDDPATADKAAAVLRDRLGLAPQDVGTGPLDLPAVSAFSLAVVAGRVPAGSVIKARKFLSAYGGRIVADIEEVRAAASLAPEPAEAESPEGPESIEIPDLGTETTPESAMDPAVAPQTAS